ncbi:ATP-binding cassette, subfamily B (MDR/TAP), member 8 [Sarotherodon galilaeus]
MASSSNNTAGANNQEQLKREMLQRLLHKVSQVMHRQPLDVDYLQFVNAEFVMASIHPQLSEKGTSKHQVELDLVNFIQDLLYESEEGQEHVADEDGPRSITPARFLQRITGQGHVPLLPSEKKDFAVVVKFNHNCEADFGNHSICYPVVSSCAKTIVLPVKHMKSYSQFRMVLLEAFHLGQEFNNV